MNFWLLKSEPDEWSWDVQKKAGTKGEQWSGVRNFQARKHMRAMKKDDLGFFYHTGNEKRIVGVVRIVAEAHPDTTDDTGKWNCVDVAAVADMPELVTLEAIRGEAKLVDMVLVRNSRLSVQPVTADEWNHVCRMGGLDPKTLDRDT